MLAKSVIPIENDSMLYTTFAVLHQDAVATYIVGAAAIGLGIWQFRRTFKQRNKIKVFEELKTDIGSAKEQLDTIASQYDNLFKLLADAADKASATNLNVTETKARLAEVDKLFLEHQKQIDSIFGSYRKVLELIRKIERSTVLKNSSQEAARYLFYAASDQHNLLTSVNDVLLSFNVTPPLGERPNISPETFTKYRDLTIKINSGNVVVSNYLDDLEVIVHNDLVKNVFGKAHVASQPPKHLTPNGFVDQRVKKSLL